jgi:hypothetical protein
MMGDPGAEFRNCTVTLRKKWGRGLCNQSGGDLQPHQPFELADFLEKARHVQAVFGFQPHGGGKVAVPGGPVPTGMIERRTCR